MRSRLTSIFYSVVVRGQLAREDGQGLVEYALILALVSIAVVGVLAALGTGIGNTLSSVVNDL